MRNDEKEKIDKWLDELLEELEYQPVLLTENQLIKNAGDCYKKGMSVQETAKLIQKDKTRTYCEFIDNLLKSKADIIKESQTAFPAWPAAAPIRM